MTTIDHAAHRVASATQHVGPAPQRAASLNPKLINAAHQFEASLMQELLAPLQKDSMSSPDSESDSGSGNAMSTFAGEAMARAISDRGGFGIATQLIAHFEQTASLSKPQP